MTGVVWAHEALYASHECLQLRRNVNGSPDVRFIDFDWAGRAGDVRYPSFMTHRDVLWPDNVREFAHVIQTHDSNLLKRHLPKWSKVSCAQETNYGTAIQALLATLAHSLHTCPCVLHFKG